MYCSLTHTSALKSAIRIPSYTTVKFESLSHFRTLKNVAGGGRVRPSASGNVNLAKFTNFSSWSSQKSEFGSSKVKGIKSSRLPWLAAKQAKEAKRVGDVAVAAQRSSWEESAERLDVRTGSKQHSVSSWEDRVKVESNAVENDSRVSGRWMRSLDYDGGNKNEKKGEESEDVEKDDEVIDDPRWDKIRNKFTRMEPMRGGYERPEVRRWNRQEEWGKKTFKEAAGQSSLPKMVGEGIYGVGPVLAALSASRREFYTLYVQEGLDLSSNNRKKKDKKGFAKILRTAEKYGISVKDATKHDLNMIVDNRPHQGLVHAGRFAFGDGASTGTRPWAYWE